MALIALFVVCVCLQPTFTFFKSGNMLGEVRGADIDGLKQAIAELKDE